MVKKTMVGLAASLVIYGIYLLSAGLLAEKKSTDLNNHNACVAEQIKKAGTQLPTKEELEAVCGKI
ncbi:hypothetical protein [Neptuniibacter sp. QD34_54]|uniref:hypothetical protein n=1 Tax=Neptuniibacter sp. QD34_54 TaxID=3398208 RepID=UPI0039F58A54